MDLPVKRYVYAPLNEKNIYVARDLQTILERTGDNDLICVYAVVELPDGETLFSTDRKYNGDFMLHDRFMHIDSFLGFHPYHKIINL